MHLKINHETLYHYEHPLRHSVQTLRLWPRNNAAQRVVSWRIDTDANSPLPAFEDSFGNVTHTLCIERAHESVRIQVTGEVVTNETHGVIGETFEAAPATVFLTDDGNLRTVHLLAGRYVFRHDTAPREETPPSLGAQLAV